MSNHSSSEIARQSPGYVPRHYPWSPPYRNELITDEPVIMQADEWIAKLEAKLPLQHPDVVAAFGAPDAQDPDPLHP